MNRDLMRYDIRPRWQRFLAPHGRGGLVALSIAWFLLGLVGFLAALTTCGWRARPLDHAWHLAAWLTFSSWIMFGWCLHRRP